MKKHEQARSPCSYQLPLKILIFHLIPFHRNYPPLSIIKVTSSINSFNPIGVQFHYIRLRLPNEWILLSSSSSFFHSSSSSTGWQQAYAEDEAKRLLETETQHREILRWGRNQSEKRQRKLQWLEKVGGWWCHNVLYSQNREEVNHKNKIWNKTKQNISPHSPDWTAAPWPNAWQEGRGRWETTVWDDGGENNKRGKKESQFSRPGGYFL